MYKIQKYTPFLLQHILALKLYTDYTTECGVFCKALRSENKSEITEIANWARLLSECVQCYGTSLKGSKRKRYYRGVDKTFTFEMFVTRFNLPTSTSTNFNRAVEFAGTGLVFEVSQYKQTYDVFKFECSKLSAFDTEKEVLFFGGNTVLKVSSIWKWTHGNWLSYRKYIEPMDCILRMINGLSIADKQIVSNVKQQHIMSNLINYVVESLTFENKYHFDCPSYIEKLLTNYASKSVIKLKYDELINGYHWLDSKLIQTNNDNRALVSISKICVLFCIADQIVFIMPDNYILDDTECESLISDIASLSQMNMVTSINLKWSTEMPQSNISNINKYLPRLLEHHWNRQYSKNSASFECTKFSTREKYNFVAQNVVFQSKVMQMKVPYIKSVSSAILPVNNYNERKPTSKRKRRYDVYDKNIYLSKRKSHLIAFGYLRNKQFEFKIDLPPDLLTM
eukprot:550312_1